MPSSYTAQNRLELQNPGENLNTWGSKLNADTIALIDFAAHGVTQLTPSGPITLTTANGAPDQARSAILNCVSGTGGTITIPGVSHDYKVRNNCSGNLVFTTGSGTTATVEPGSLATVICDGTNCYRFADAADIAACLASAKAYTDAAAFSSASGNLPGQAGNAGKFLVTNGTSPSWLAITSGNVTSALGYTPQVALGYTPLNKASNLSDVPSPSAALTVLGGVSSTFLTTNYWTIIQTGAYLAANYAPLISPPLSGTPTTPTAAPLTDNTQIASTAYADAAVAAGIAGLVAFSYGHFRNQQTSGTASGESLSNTAWTQRVLNTTLVNNIAGASLGSNQITLPVGVYEVSASASAVNSSGTGGSFNHKLRVRNITDSATLINGQNYGTSNNGTTVPTSCNATLQGRFTINGTKTIELDSFTNYVTSTSGGTAIASGEPEVYVDIYIRKIG